MSTNTHTHSFLLFFLQLSLFLFLIDTPLVHTHFLSRTQFWYMKNGQNISENKSECDHGVAKPSVSKFMFLSLIDTPLIHILSCSFNMWKMLRISVKTSQMQQMLENKTSQLAVDSKHSLRTLSVSLPGPGTYVLGVWCHWVNNTGHFSEMTVCVFCVACFSVCVCFYDQFLAFFVHPDITVLVDWA